MKYDIIAENFPMLVCELNEGESVITQRGGMSWRHPDIKMETSTIGGVKQGLRRTLSGNNFFLNRYTATGEAQEIAFGLTFPGSIKVWDVSDGNDIIVQKNAFIAATQNVNIDVTFNRRLGATLLSGEGFVLERFSGTGIVFIEIDGKMQEFDLAEGEKLVVDNGLLAAMEPTVDFSVEAVKGLKNVMFGGEGLFVNTLTGPGKVWLQTLPVTGLARMLAPTTTS